MLLRSIGFIAMLAALAFGAAPPFAVAASDHVCMRRFFQYDRTVLMFSGSGTSDGLVVSPNVGSVGQRLFDAGCVTRERDLVGLGSLERALRGTLVGESGPAIRPVSLHVGIVPGFAAEAQMRMFFGDLGYRVSSIGAPMLGRRIFIGPFATQGGLSEATEVALQAGFIAPYPRRFGR